MGKNQLTYCCSNPDCGTKFTMEQAKQTTALLQPSPVGVGMHINCAVPVVHILCPSCKTIAASIHVPADPI